ncbi:2-C-methyl-D-erythritol 4-phosphate cytidylyltransferase [Pedobacter lusitanus]|uniref:2-C-methyl-D-erythritol 4-phosphate cytidylyltransferase n=1 Tax=Pedobacter lusitanus TaxID=1503925 RepID=A0A0D0GLB7_9SPHI|nr:2-C-methyl-D-erythritol 4-phosphate cytidylyltransferase [Pedobacter lusitanus]KIO75216.1 2-C-methyl-D-erythritol 4-phosphate cytidylyltransferase [Pedobacter lusitanus]
MNYFAIIVAGGKGNRMNLAIAKQFLELDGKPILMHTLEAFSQCALNPKIILVLNIHQHLFWEELCSKHDFKVPHEVVKGGQERFDSVRNGLKTIKGKAIVAIHDAVRPLITPELILRSYQMAEETGNAVTAIQPVDSVRMKREGQASEALNRDELFLIQTPQTFQIEQLKKAYLQPYRNEFTDDASVVERAGYPINLLPGERNNIKITYEQDLEMASFLLKKKGF